MIWRDGLRFGRIEPMRWRLRPKPKRVPGEYPESFVKAWMARTLPTATPAEAASAVAHLRAKGWTEEKLAAFILPYMPRDGGRSPRLEGGGATSALAPSAVADAWQSDEQPVAPRPDEQRVAAPGGDPPFALPPDVTRSWLDAHLPQMDRRQLRLAVDELERRGWPSGVVALAVLPHLLPALPAADARAVVAGLAELGMTEAEIARATTPA